VWDLLAEELGGRHRLLGVDLRGRGLSGKPPAGSYGWKRHLRDIGALLEKLNVGPITVVGHSMGGILAALFAAEQPAAVDRAVVVDVGLEEESDPEIIRQQLAGSLNRLKMEFPSWEDYAAYWKQLPYIGEWREHMDRFLECDAEVHPDGTVTSRVSAEGVEEDFLEPSAWKEELPQVLSRTKAPHLVLWAPRGLMEPGQPLFSRRAVENFAALIPNSRVRTMEDVNHYTIVTSPGGAKQTAAAIEEFLREKPS